MSITEPQQIAYDAYLQNGRNIRATARALNEAYSGVRRKIITAEKWINASEGQKAAIENTGLDITSGQHGWRKVKNKDGSADSVFWKADSAVDATALIEAIREGLESLPPPAVYDCKAGPDNLAAIFPVADLHTGLLTDAEELGEDWDSKIAQAHFQRTFGRLVSVTPSAGVALIGQLGDLTHSDDQRNVTPQSGHQLDVDTRYFMILRRATGLMKWAIEALRQKYARVIYRGCRGNHDMTSHYAVTLALSEYYAGVDGVEIITDANEFFVWQFGSNMLLLHHGDKAKPERLVTFAAAQWPEIWGATKHRLTLSGHVHHETRKEIGGMAFESIGTIIPRDSFAYSHAYTATRGLISMVLDKVEGEISRNRVSL